MIVSRTRSRSLPRHCAANAYLRAQMCSSSPSSTVKSKHGTALIFDCACEATRTRDGLQPFNSRGQRPAVGRFRSRKVDVLIVSSVRAVRVTVDVDSHLVTITDVFAVVCRSAYSLRVTTSHRMNSPSYATSTSPMPSTSRSMAVRTGCSSLILRRLRTTLSCTRNS